MHHLRAFERREVVVVMTENIALTGTLINVGKDGVTLAEASVADDRTDGQPQRIEGMAVIPTSRVMWVQVLGKQDG